MSRCHPISLWVKVLTLTCYMISSLPLCPQILPFSLPLPTSLLQPHSLLTVWQHQSHLTSELLPSTWIFFPQRATWFIPYLLSYCSNVGFSVRSSLTTPYKKALVHPQSQILQGNIFQKVFPNFSFSSSTSKWKIFSSFQVPLPYFPCDLLVLPCITFTGAFLFPLYPGLLKVNQPLSQTVLKLLCCHAYLFTWWKPKPLLSLGLLVPARILLSPACEKLFIDPQAKQITPIRLFL